MRYAECALPESDSELIGSLVIPHAMLFAATSNSVMCVKNEHRTLGWDFGLTHTGKPLGGTRRSLGIAAIAMNEHEHHRTLRQQNDFASPFARR